MKKFLIKIICLVQLCAAMQSPAQGLPGVTTGADGPAGHRTITFTHSNGTFDIYS